MKESTPLSKVGQLKEDGSLGPLEEACILRAGKTFRNRFKTDTNPSIVRMVVGGKPINHWYYRSDQWIDQPYFSVDPSLPLQSYVGPTNMAPRFSYKEGTYIIDNEAMEDCMLE